MNLLFLKTIAMDPVTQTYHSPQKKDYIWSDDIMVAQCEKCAPVGTIGNDCHCGIYGSPNPEALVEYARHPTSFNVLLQAYGKVDIWTAPQDVGDGLAYVLRSWAARVVAIVEDTKYQFWDSDNRATAAITASLLLNVSIYPLKLAKEMIATTWREHAGFDPYDNKGYPWFQFGYEWENQ